MFDSTQIWTPDILHLPKDHWRILGRADHGTGQLDASGLKSHHAIPRSQEATGEDGEGPANTGALTKSDKDLHESSLGT